MCFRARRTFVLPAETSLAVETRKMAAAFWPGRKARARSTARSWRRRRTVVANVWASAAAANTTRNTARASGKVRTFAWYELVPSPSVPIKLQVPPGDLIQGQVSISGRTVTLVLRDQTEAVQKTFNPRTGSQALAQFGFIVVEVGNRGGNPQRSKWYHNFGAYGRFTGSLLSGQFRNFLTEANNNGVTPIVDVREKYYQVVPVTELGLGVAWQGEHVRFSVGYELQNWFDMVNSPTFPSPSNIGLPVRRFSDLSLEGLAVQVGVIF